MSVGELVNVKARRRLAPDKLEAVRKRDLEGSTGDTGVDSIGVGGEVSRGGASSGEEGEEVTLIMKADIARKAYFEGLAKLRRRRSWGTLS